ncbi:hypothetical protein BAE30_16630 [Acidithiobacillus caldus]|uniref:Uncharacterized protein n=1 Tax=Acidithiobacillus caldus TaxID=33059 RepID=A0A1E7YRT5_9PROT|nr:hypothetical protein BAE30_16630 [Acidithiobacillus caldus]
MNGATKKVITRKPISEPLTIRELTGILIKHYKKKTGHYEIGPEFAFTVGQGGPGPDKILPTAMVGLSRVTLLEVSEPTPMSVDAESLYKKK